jgi:hypothetical protein
VHVCVVGDSLILLDLRRDKYLSMSALAARALSCAVPGWPVTTSEIEELPRLSAAQVQQIVQYYIENRVLTAIESEGKSGMPIRYLPARELVPLGFEPDFAHSISSKDVRSFIYAATLAAYRLRTLSLHAIVRKVADRKTRATHRQSFDPQLAAELAFTYRKIQAFAFSGRNRCLLQSLCFANFLACYGLFPNWVFGVQTRPFAAHCWLQQNHYLLNETPDGVKRFTPIFAV